MKKLILAALLVLILSMGAFAYQQPLSDFGFSTLSNTSQSTKSCKELTISLQESALSEKGAGILSLNASFDGNAWDTTYVLVSLNDGEEKVVWPEDFACTTNNCWARIFLPDFKKSDTKVKLCAVLGGINKGIQILPSSYIGIYDTPMLSIKTSAPTTVRLGDRAKMTTTVSNTGTKSADIFVQFVHPDTRAKVPITSFDIVEGDSSASTSIAPGEVKTFTYYIKPTIISSYNLPSAALFFKNFFGESQSMLSEHPAMSVSSTKKIEVSLVALSENPAVFKAIVKNNFAQQFDGNIMISPQTKFELPAQEISVSPQSEKEITFTANDLAKGDYTFFATIRDGNEIFSSNNISMQVSQEGIPIQIIVVAVFLIIGAAIFGWIYLTTEK